MSDCAAYPACACDYPDMVTADRQTTDLPPDFRLIQVSAAKWVCINISDGDDYCSVWPSEAVARSAAWDWFHDVKCY